MLFIAVGRLSATQVLCQFQHDPLCGDERYVGAACHPGRCVHVCLYCSDTVC